MKWLKSRKAVVRLLDVRTMPEVINLINKELSAGNIIEIKKERENIAVIRIDRKVKVKAPITGSEVENDRIHSLQTYCAEQ